MSGSFFGTTEETMRCATDRRRRIFVRAAVLRRAVSIRPAAAIFSREANASLVKELLTSIKR
jgi:hypothetical protein